MASSCQTNFLSLSTVRFLLSVHSNGTTWTKFQNTRCLMHTSLWQTTLLKKPFQTLQYRLQVNFMHVCYTACETEHFLCCVILSNYQPQEAWRHRSCNILASNTSVVKLLRTVLRLYTLLGIEDSKFPMFMEPHSRSLSKIPIMTSVHGIWEYNM
jgi:hypothetical protein